MTFRLNALSIIIIAFLLSSCGNKIPKSTKQELNKMSLTNKNKFEKVIDYFGGPDNKLKRLAVYSIIENINDFGFYYSEQLCNYDTLFDVLANKPKDFNNKIPWYSNQVNIIFDSIEIVYGKLDARGLTYKHDVDVFTSKQIVSYINNAFEAWQQPWSKDVSFEEFCEYILPYRFGNEKLEDWRTLILKEYSWLHDSISKDANLIKVAAVLNRNAELKYASGLGRYITSIAPSNLVKAHFGNCSDMAAYKAMVLRSFGVPVCVDYFPQYGNDPNKHFWNAISDENGDMLSMDHVIGDINASVAYKYKIAKVYRKTLSKQEEFLKIQEHKNILGIFKDARQMDVTEKYVAVTDLELKIDEPFLNGKLVYLCLFNNSGFTPIAVSEVKKGEAYFRKLGREVLYFPFYIQDNVFKSAGNAFVVDNTGEIDYKKVKNQQQELILTRKYHMHRRKLNWLNCLISGIFQGSNDPDFSNAIDLGKICGTPSQYFHELSVNSNKAFKYLRFIFNSQELKLPYDGDGASIAEIEFIDEKGNVIKGTPIGTDADNYSEYTPEKCFDGNVLTFFEDPRRAVEEKWVGLSLEKPTALSKIKYCARNDLNNVQKGDLYELFYWNNSTFISLGQKVATDTLLNFPNCPSNTVYWLRNLSGGTEERVFTYENGKQIWW